MSALTSISSNAVYGQRSIVEPTRTAAVKQTAAALEFFSIGMARAVIRA